jgi:glycosyltransferase involved in cell wall biosynthesis
MRVAMFMPALSPASLGWHVHLDLAHAMQQLGDRFEILTTSSPADSQSAEQFAAAGVRVLPAPAFIPRHLAGLAAPLLRTRLLLPTASALSQYLRVCGRRIDALYVEVAYPHGVAASLAVAASRWSGPLLITPAGDDVVVVPEAHFGFRRYPLPRWLVGWSLRRATAVRCVSPRLEGIVRELGLGGTVRVFPVNVARQTVEIAFEDPAEKDRRRREARSRLAAQWKLGKDPIILSLGRLHPVKALDVLIEAIATVPRGILLIAGPSLEVRPIGDMARHLQALAHARGVGDRVRLLGRVFGEEVFDLLAAADVVAVPSHHESLNKVCIEAAAVGTPFVVSATSGICSYLPPTLAAEVVPSGDSSSLAASLNRILRGGRRIDPTAAKEFVSRFSPQRIAAELHAFLEELTPPAAR